MVNTNVFSNKLQGIWKEGRPGFSWLEEGKNVAWALREKVRRQEANT